MVLGGSQLLVAKQERQVQAIVGSGLASIPNASAQPAMGWIGIQPRMPEH
jgi:hypothetical protein